MTRKNAYSIIKEQLKSGAKTLKELRKACEKRGISTSTFYYHMKQLVNKLKEIEKIRVEDAQGRVVEKYSLVEEKVVFWEKSSGIRGFSIGGIEVEVPSNRRVLELAAWIKREPKGWKSDIFEVKVAKLYLEHSGYLVPDIVSAPEDPDAYAFQWPSEELERLDIEELKRLDLYRCVHSRFFNLKSVYDVLVDDSNKKGLSTGAVFVGAHSAPMVVDHVGVYGAGMHPLPYVGRPIGYEPVNELGSVCVAVCKEEEGMIRVMRVEKRWGKLDKTWVKSLTKQLNAKKFRMIEFESLKEDVKRELLINLRGILEQHKLLIPKRYVKLIEELLDYSYKKPSSTYVSALATAVDLCQKE